MRKWAGRTTLLILTLWIASAAGRVLWAQVSPIQGIPSPAATGSVTITGTATVAGAKTNNNAVPGATNVGVLPCIANAAAPTWTETLLVALSCNLAGDLRVIVSNAVALGQTTKSASTPVTLASDQFPDPCTMGTKVPVSINISTATTTTLVSASASNKLYICKITLVTNAANNVALVEDATAACASPDAGLAGGVTAATGWNFAANGGLVEGGGIATVEKTASTNVNVCLMTSAATQLSGSIQYVLAP